MSQQTTDSHESTGEIHDVPECDACGEEVGRDGDEFVRVQSKRLSEYRQTETRDGGIRIDYDEEWTGNTFSTYCTACFIPGGAGDPPAYKFFRIVEADSGTTHALIPRPPWRRRKAAGGTLGASNVDGALTVCGMDSFDRDDGRKPSTYSDLNESVTCGNCLRGLDRAKNEVTR